ncbi:hypothetical protein KIL84_001960 [Mauremys mutica]|uniref:Uncharacterized protein n=1 Tax=Mauremys mutica TaxID=74926 RepID=A0A9D3XK46_9SAUR|nr:hypothetical protein KIL84_001960 [Mauremys mutica]
MQMALRNMCQAEAFIRSHGLDSDGWRKQEKEPGGVSMELRDSKAGAEQCRALTSCTQHNVFLTSPLCGSQWAPDSLSRPLPLVSLWIHCGSHSVPHWRCGITEARACQWRNQARGSTWDRELPGAVPMLGTWQSCQCLPVPTVPTHGPPPLRACRC